MTQATVLDNVRAQLSPRRPQLVADVRSHGDIGLARYLDEAMRELVDIYRGGRSWTELRREAGFPTPPSGPDEATRLRRIAALAQVDDAERADAYTVRLQRVTLSVPR